MSYRWHNWLLFFFMHLSFPLHTVVVKVHQIHKSSQSNVFLYGDEHESVQPQAPSLYNERMQEQLNQLYNDLQHHTIYRPWTDIYYENPLPPTPPGRFLSELPNYIPQPFQVSPVEVSHAAIVAHTILARDYCEHTLADDVSLSYVYNHHARILQETQHRISELRLGRHHNPTLTMLSAAEASIDALQHYQNNRHISWDMPLKDYVSDIPRETKQEMITHITRSRHYLFDMSMACRIHENDRPYIICFTGYQHADSVTTILTNRGGYTRINNGNTESVIPFQRITYLSRMMLAFNRYNVPSF